MLGMSDYRSIFFEMAANAMPKRFFLAKGGCGGEAIVAAPNEYLARELAARIWKSSGGADEPLEWFEVEEVPLILCPEGFVPASCYDAKGDMKVIGGSQFFGDTDKLREAIETARENYEQYSARIAAE
jgi:hypothetical protein